MDEYGPSGDKAAPNPAGSSGPDKLFKARFCQWLSMSERPPDDEPQSRYRGWQWILLVFLLLPLLAFLGFGYHMQHSAGAQDYAKVQFFPENDTIIVTQTVQGEHKVGVVHFFHGDTSSEAELNALGDRIILNESGLTVTGSARVLQNGSKGIEDGDEVRVHAYVGQGEQSLAATKEI